MRQKPKVFDRSRYGVIISVNVHIGNYVEDFVQNEHSTFRDRKESVHVQSHGCPPQAAGLSDMPCRDDAFLFGLYFAAGHSSVDLYVDAVMYKEFQQNDLAIEKLNSAIKENKKFSLAYSLLGDIYQEMKEYEKSADSYEMATELNPWSFRDYFSLGKVYEVMKKFTNAVKAYKQAVEIKPDNFEANLGVARTSYQIHDYNDALVYGRKAEEINPDAARGPENPR